METSRGGEDQEISHSDEEEDEDLSTADQATTSEGDAMEERVGSGPEASAEGHGLDDTDRGDQEETAIVRPSSADEPLKESARSSTGSGVPSVARNVSVNTGLRNIKVSEGDASGKGERNPGYVSCKSPWSSVVDVYSDAVRPPPLRFPDARGRSRSRWQCGHERRPRHGR